MERDMNFTDRNKIDMAIIIKFTLTNCKLMNINLKVGREKEQLLHQY